MEKQEIKQYAQEVAEKLGETDEKPIQQMELIIEHMGKEFVEQQLQKTEDIEANGGMKIEDKSRRRTKGGVFFYIAKANIPPDTRALIFPNYGQAAKGKVLEWTERAKHIQPMLDEPEEHGEMQFVKMYIQGRPGKIIILDNSVMTTISHEQQRSPMPRGVPHPPEQAQIYTVYMGIKQWEPVKPYLDKYKTDKLMIEGTIVWDDELNTFAVFAESVTSKRLEKAKRQEARENSKDQLKKAEEEASTPQLSDDEERSTEFEIDVPVPDGAPPEVAKKLKQLHNAAATLRHKIKTMEDEGKKSGIGMTKRLLQNTEKQIAALEKQYT